MKASIKACFYLQKSECEEVKGYAKVHTGMNLLAPSKQHTKHACAPEKVRVHTSKAAIVAAPEEIPQNRPSLRPSSFAIAMASSEGTCIVRQHDSRPYADGLDVLLAKLRNQVDDASSRHAFLIATL